MAKQLDANYLAFCLSLPVESIYSFAVLIQHGIKFVFEYANAGVYTAGMDALKSPAKINDY
ncbi:hypothetical protein [Advenella mimigardefordensis]|uniref:hypothetical protein n=1 Tax=Advenella mimigardefordensis TaxID=302406 RepID=UPI001182EC3F|nr:hypothetical protein [Advenella mimigardefordensis]